jgi:hypothetical protein
MRYGLKGAEKFFLNTENTKHPIKTPSTELQLPAEYQR